MLRKRIVKEWSPVDLIVFEALLPPDHRLRKVAAAVDFEAFEEELAQYYHPSIGRPGDAVMMTKLVFLQFFYGLRDDGVMKRAQTDIAMRWFLDLGLNDQLPNPSSLSVFRSRLGVEGTQRVLDELVRQCRQHGLLKYRLRLKDATHVLANVAVPATLTLLAEARDRLLAAARPFAPDQVVAAEARLGEIRMATHGLREDLRLIPRVEFLWDVLAWAEAIEPPAAVSAAWTKFEKARALARKIVGEAEDPEAGDRTRSVHDPDARRGKHGAYFDGYLLDVLMDADSELITAVNLLPANGAEGADAAPLVRHEESVTGEDVAALSLDGAGYDGKVLRELQDPEGLNLDVYVPPKESPTPGKFSPADFKLDSEGRSVTCPGGQTAHYRQRDASRHTTVYRFPQATCAECPLRGHCLGREPTGPFGRTVRKNDYDPEYEAVRAKAGTPAYTAVKQEHPKVERKLAELVRRHGARYARYRGLPKILCQQIWTVTAVNIKRMIKLLELRPATS
jgi:transposase